MAAGTYKNGVKIDLVYQAAGLLAAAAPVGTVFDEAGVIDAPKSTSLTSQLLLGELTGVAAGRYLGHFTPDATGRWTVVIQDKNGAGEVSKVYEVGGYDIDTIGETLMDGTGLLALVSAIDAADIASQLLITQSAVNAAVASDMLLTQSSVISSVKSAQLVMQSTLGGYISNVESALDILASPAMVS